MSKVENGNQNQKLEEKSFNETYKSILEGEVTGKLIAIAHESTNPETDKYTMGNITIVVDGSLHMYVCNENKLKELEVLKAQMMATRSQPKITLFIVPAVLKSGEGVRGRVAGFSPEFD